MTEIPPLREIPIERMAGVGERSASLFRALDVATAQDLLDHLPFRYDDLREPTPAAELGAVPLDAGEQNALGRILAVNERRVRGLEIVEVRAEDESGAFVAKWIGRNRYAIGRFRAGMRLFVRGRLQRSLLEPVMNVTHYRILSEDERYRGALVPIYRASKDLPSRKIAAVVKKNLHLLLQGARDDVLSSSVANRRGFPPLADAYRMAHAPETPEDAKLARERFIFAEFLIIAAGAQLRRAQRESEHDASAFPAAQDLLERLERSLPFTLTGAQRRVIREIWADMSRDVPMNRLLQGDVGSGKTVVAAAAALLAARAQHQTALMAPTELLAAQHVEKLSPLLMPFGVAVEPILGSQGERARQRAIDRIASGEAALAIGTHALLSEGVEFAKLGLAIIDEQHRFGVEHRARLRAKGGAPHTLHMTATPIPRSLAQSLYADLDDSRLDEMPPGRPPVRTFTVRSRRLERVYEFARAVVVRGGQAYVVAPAIDETENGITGAVAQFERMKKQTFPDFTVGLVHGRLAARDRDAVMQRFARGGLDVLVATTVIEVGVDVPNANLMVVLDAHRYGLAQLHQLRGRVGRGAGQSYCIYVYADDAAEGDRLAILTKTSDGFAIAEADLELRGAGEFAGTVQHGKAQLRFGDLARDFAMYEQARSVASDIVKRDPTLRLPEHAALSSALESARKLHELVTSS